MKNRTFYLDNVCCILILHMIYTCHISASCGGLKIPLISTTLSFFMSWFFFKLFWSPFENYDLWIRYLILSSIVTISLILADMLFRNKKARIIIGG